MSGSDRHLSSSLLRFSTYDAAALGYGMRSCGTAKVDSEDLRVAYGGLPDRVCLMVLPQRSDSRQLA